MSFPPSQLSSRRGRDFFLHRRLGNPGRTPSTGEREEEEERRRRTAGGGGEEEEGRMRGESSSCPRSNGEEGDFFSLLLGNHITGLQTPRGEIEEEKTSMYRSISSSGDKGERISVSPIRSSSFFQRKEAQCHRGRRSITGLQDRSNRVVLRCEKKREGREL